MSVNVTIAGQVFAFPTDGEEDWGSTVTDWAVRVSQKLLQTTGGAFTLSGEVDFGGSFATKQIYVKSRTANPASAGFGRLAKTDVFNWRNNANNADIPLGIDTSNNLTWNSNIVITDVGGVVPVTKGGTGFASYTTGDTLYASGATTLAKLGIGTANYVLSSSGSAPQWGLLVNANVDAAAAIAFSKMAALTASKSLESSAGGVVVVASGTGYAKLASGTPSYASTIPRADVALGSASHVLINDITGAMSSEATLAVARGGLNLSSYTTGDLVYASSSTVLAKLGIGSTGQALKVVAGAPAWGTLAEAGGGTNQTSYTTGDLLYASAPNTLSKLAIGSSGQILKVTAGAPAWSTPAASFATTAKAANYTLTSSDDAVTGDSSGGAFTFTLPSCASNPGKVYYLKKITSDVTAITIARAGSDTIQDAASTVTSTTINTFGEEIVICSFGGTVWQILSRRIPSIWIAFTPTSSFINGNVTPTGFWRRVGDSMEVMIDYEFAGTPTAATSLTCTLPLSLSVDTTKLPSSSASHQVVGTAQGIDTGVTTNIGICRYSSSTDVNFISQGTAGWSTTVPFSWNNADIFSATFKVPISGWNG